MQTINKIIDFQLPQNLACPLPTEERGLTRDEVRLLVTSDNGQQVNHAQFSDLAKWLETGDVLVVNTSATLPAALEIDLPNHRQGVVHLSNRLHKNTWLIEIREVIANKTVRWKEGQEGMVFDLPQNGQIVLKQRFYKDQQLLDLWEAVVITPQSLPKYLSQYAWPIKYAQLQQRYPLAYYQSYFSFQPGSSEMPSASRGFTQKLVNKLLQKGIVFAPLLLHTGVSSLEENEKPYPEYMEINALSASIINQAKAQGKKVIAVGTTAIRALESAVNDQGLVLPYKGNTDLFIEESYAMKVANGLLTGFHEPKASHLHMLQSLTSSEHLAGAYKAAIQQAYHWHEFGDLHLLLAS